MSKGAARNYMLCFDYGARGGRFRLKTMKPKTKLEGLSEKIFLDRYARKDADYNNAKVGDVVLALTKDDPKFPTKEVGEVIAREGSKVTVRTRSGEVVETTV